VPKIDPKDADAYTNRGIAKAILEQYEAAIEDFDQAIRLDPKDVTAYYNRGIAKVSLEQYETAIQDYDQAIRLEPKLAAAAYYKRGISLLKLNRTDEAVPISRPPCASPRKPAMKNWPLQSQM